jgi:hypothetical protein
MLGIDRPVRGDILGTVAAFDDDAGTLRAAGRFAADGEYRVRLCGRAADRDTAKVIAREVLSLYCCGPAGGGGVRTAVTPRIRTASCYVPAAMINPTICLMSAADG